MWMIISDGFSLALFSLAYALASPAGAERWLSPDLLLSECSLAFGSGRCVRTLGRGRRQMRCAKGDAGRFLREIESRDP